MNNIYRLVRNTSTGQWVVVSELAHQRGKSAAGKAMLLLQALLGAGGTLMAGAAAAACDGLSGNVVTCSGYSSGDLSAASSGATTATATNWTHEGGGLFLNASDGDITFNGDNVKITDGSSPDGRGLLHIVADGEHGASLTINGSSFRTADASNAQGLIAQTIGNGNAVTRVTGTSVVMGAGSAGPAVQAIASGGGAGNAMLEFRSGSIVTTGVGGLNAMASGSGGVSIIERDSVISTSGVRAHAINARIADNGSGSITIDSTGAITTSGDFSHGINADGGTGDIRIGASGNIVTDGMGAMGIRAVGKGDVSIDSSGDITTLSTSRIRNSPNDETHAILGLSSGNGDVRINASGKLETHAVDSSGVRGIATGSGRVDIVYSGSLIRVHGNDSDGLFAQNSGSGDVSVTTSGRGLIETHGGGNGFAAHGIVSLSAQGNATVNNTMDIVTGFSRSSNGILSESTGGGRVTIYNSGDIVTNGRSSYGIHTISNSGALQVVNSGAIVTNGVDARGISAISNRGNVTVVSTGAVSMLHPDVYAGSGTVAAIYATTGNAGAVTVEASGALQAGGSNGHGIYASTSGSGNVDIYYSGPSVTINGGGDGLRGEATGTGNVSIVTEGEGAVKNTYAAGNAVHGVAALAQNGRVYIENAMAVDTGNASDSTAILGGAVTGDVAIVNKGAVFTAGEASYGVRGISNNGAVAIVNSGDISSSGDRGGGIKVSAVDGAISLVNQATVVATGMGATAVSVVAPGELSISNSGVLSGGWGQFGAAAINLIGSEATVATITNGGSIGALSDHVIDGYFVGGNDAGSGAMSDHAIGSHSVGSPTLSIRNSAGAEMTGYITLDDGINTLDNAGIWALRNLSDSDGDGVRDTLAVAISDFGGHADSAIRNTGTLALLGGAAATVDLTGYFDTGHAANTLASDGAVQGHILGVSRFENNGIIDLQANAAAGDVLLISGGHAAGVSGNGTYVSEGGLLKVDTVLNEGGSNSQSDMLVADGVELGKGGATAVNVNRVGGNGALTVGNGIEVVRVLDGATRSAAGAFVLDGRVMAGVYEYILEQGGKDDPDDGNWYLRNTVPSGAPNGPATPPANPRANPLPDIDPAAPELHAGPGDELPIYRPEPFAYLANQIAANGMFQHTLHERLGEPNYAERTRGDERNTNGWVRVQGHQLDTRTAEQIGADIDSWMMQGGVELGRWSAGGSRFHLGGMVGTGRSTTRLDSEITRHKAIGRVKGNSLGMYATWYANAAEPAGLYVDSWLQYGRYDNEVNGEGQAKESYKSSSLAFSLEAGYAWQLRDNGRSALYIEPQAQAIFTDYSSDRFTETSGLEVRAGGDAEVLTRLGARLYGHTTNAQHNMVQPFVEANWWHAAQEASMRFDGQQLDRVLPRDRYEVKLGAEVELGGNWTGWGHLGYQQGKQDYKNLDGLIGIKRVW